MMRSLAVFLAILAGMCSAPAQQSTVEAHLGRGSQLMQDHRFEVAAKEFEEAVALDPADPRAHFQLAVCLLSLGHNNEALRQFEEVRKLAGESPYITYYLGRLSLLTNDYATAIKRLASVAKDPPFPDTAFYLGVAYVSSGDVAEGTQWLERAAKLMPDDYRIHYRLARAYSMAGRKQDAEHEYTLYTQLQQKFKSTETGARACSAALRTGPPATAREVCNRLLDPNDPGRLTLLGQLYGDAGAYSEALDPLKRAVELDPKSFDAWHNLGLTYFRLHQYADARVPLEKAVALRPDFYGSVVLLGATYYMLGDDKAALPVLEHAHRLNPADVQTAEILEKLRARQQKK